MGNGCVGQLPGMGGADESRNFILNCKAWDKIPFGKFDSNIAELRIAPMTGSVENVGYPDEKSFYFDIVKKAAEEKIPLSIGDGCPDEKLLWGIEAVREKNTKAAVFIKPYENKRILERIEWAGGIMEFCGIDIDAYNIVTMRNKVRLEKKSAASLLEIKKILERNSIPFVIKGIFTDEDVQLVKELKPYAAYISNHGGRVPTAEGSTAEFLLGNFDEIKNSCAEVWVDGGIRTRENFEKAQSHGVSRILLGRPFATALCYGRPFSKIL